MFEKLESFTRDVSDLQTKPVFNSPEEAKFAFDAAPDEVRKYLNKLIVALQSTTEYDSGAKNIGATTIPGLSGNDVQVLIENLFAWVKGFGIGVAGYNAAVLNDLGGNGFYLCNTYTGGTNAPHAGYWHVIQQMWTANDMVQLAIDEVSSDVYVRTKTNGTWNPWYGLVASSNGYTRTEVIEVTFNPDGSSASVQTNVTFAKPYTVKPTIKPADITSQTSAYSDSMKYPFIFNQSTTGFSVKLSAIGGNFGAGTIKMNFEVSGK